ncbi:hypothetical protein SEA_BOILGATE_46 [Mycobacterium phage Boilgate]|nr:hypothetical protein SEA_BOILGATE_46 [Mycobacterium phage Boilgate]
MTTPHTVTNLSRDEMQVTERIIRTHTEKGIPLAVGVAHALRTIADLRTTEREKAAAS